MPARAAGGVGVVAAIRNYRPTRKRLAAWAAAEPALNGLSFTGLKATLLDHGVDPARKDELLAALVRLAHQDPNAVMALAACLYPGLAPRVRPRAMIIGTDEAWAATLTGLASAIARHDPTERPRWIANRLIDRAIRAARAEVEGHLRHLQRNQPTDHQHLQHLERPGADDIEPSAELLVELAESAGVIAPIDTTLIKATWLNGLRLREAAALLGMSYELAKKPPTRPRRARRPLPNRGAHDPAAGVAEGRSH